MLKDNEHPNAIAKLGISVVDKSIEVVEEYGNVRQIMANENKRSKKNQKSKKTQQNGTDDIWKAFGMGTIDLSYAIVGYTLSGRAVVDHQMLESILACHGFAPATIIDFTYEFDEYSSQNDKSPILMTNANYVKLMQDFSQDNEKSNET